MRPRLQEDIRRAFRRLSVKLHPDKVQAAAAARAANKQATAATAATAASAAAAAAAAAADAADAADAASSDATADAPTTPPAATVPATPASSSVGKGGEQPVDLAAAEAFKRIVAAYDLIGDSSSRALYDGMGGKGFQTREEFESAQAESGRTTRDMYSGSSAVASLSLATFHAADSAAQPVLVKFFAPWCSHCQDLAPEFKRAAILLEDDATVGAVDCDVHHALCHEQRISRFPTVRLFPHGPARGGAVEFQGPVHEAEQLVEFVNGIVHTKLQTVTEATFHSQVLRDDSHLWLLVFGAPWCGPCGALAPMVRDVANTLHPVVQVGAVDCDAEVQWCGRMVRAPFAALRGACCVCSACRSHSWLLWRGCRTSKGTPPRGCFRFAAKTKPTNSTAWAKSCCCRRPTCRTGTFCPSSRTCLASRSAGSSAQVNPVETPTPTRTWTGTSPWTWTRLQTFKAVTTRCKQRGVTTL